MKYMQFYAFIQAKLTKSYGIRHRVSEEEHPPRKCMCFGTIQPVDVEHSSELESAP